MDVNSDDFMFAVGISGLNMSDTTQKQYFSLKMKNLRSLIHRLTARYQRISISNLAQVIIGNNWVMNSLKLSKDKNSQGIYVFLGTRLSIYRENIQVRNSFTTESKFLIALVIAERRLKSTHGLQQTQHFLLISITQTLL